KETASIVNALIGAGMPRPPVVMGRIIEALAKAGVFRLRSVLIGTAAYQTYPAVLGFRISQSAAITGDVDIAQFPSIS
ncbi:GSU2403 family nucleotidyltransferase fold protein, partial [Acinetobacter baumannii]